MLTTAVTLGAQGITHIDTSAQAASALRPIAGEFAFALFSLGIIGTATVIGAALCFSPLDPIKALYWSAVMATAVLAMFATMAF